MRASLPGDREALIYVDARRPAPYVTFAHRAKDRRVNTIQQEAVKKEPRPVPNALLLFEIDTSEVREEAVAVLNRFFLDLLKAVLAQMPER